MGFDGFDAIFVDGFFNVIPMLMVRFGEYERLIGACLLLFIVVI